MAKTKYINVKNMKLPFDLTMKENVVLSYLCSFRGKYIYASNAHMCDVLKISDRTLYRILSSLEEKELILRKTISSGRTHGKERKIYISSTAKQAYHV